MDSLATARLVSAGVYFVALIVYGIGHLASSSNSSSTSAPASTSRKRHSLRTILYDNVIVTGLNALLGVYLAMGGPSEHLWIVYSFSCVYLMRSFYTLLTLEGTDSETQRSQQAQADEKYRMWKLATDRQDLLAGLTFLTLITGYVITQSPNHVVRIVLFALDFVPFVGSVVALVLAAREANATRNTLEHSASMIPAVLVYATLVVWVGYPITMLLGPRFLGTIGSVQRDTGYLVLDVVTKHGFMAVAALYVWMRPDPKSEVIKYF